MADFTTSVSYDVSAAVTELERLDTKVTESGRKAEDAFNRGEDGSKHFEDGLKKTATSANEVIGAITLLAAETGAVVGGFVAAAVVAARMTEELAAQTLGYENASQQLDDFLEKTEQLRRFQQGATDISNAAVNTQIERRLFLLGRSQQAEARTQIAGIANEQQALNVRIAAQRTFYSQLDSLANKSASEREKAETKLSDLVSKTSERRFLSSISRFTNNAQISKIIEQAESLQKAGGDQNLDAAQSLLDTALSKADGNASNIKRVEEAINGLIAARQAAANAAKLQNEADQAAANTAAAAVRSSQDESAALRTKAQAIQQQIQQNALLRADAARQNQDNQKQQAFDAAQLKFKVQLAQLDTASRTQVTPGQRALSSFQSPFSLIIPDAEVQRQRDLVDRAEQLQIRIDKNLQRNQTPQGVIGQTANIEEFSGIVSELKGLPNLAGAFEPDLTKLERARDILHAIQQSTQAIAASSGFLTGQGPERLNPQRPSSAGPAQSNAPALPAARPAVQQNIQVDLSVRGGMIDSDTVQQLTERVAREIRKGTVAQ